MLLSSDVCVHGRNVRVISFVLAVCRTPTKTKISRTHVDVFFPTKPKISRTHAHIFLFDFPFHEIYRRLLFFTLWRMSNTLWYQVRVMCQMRMIPGTYCTAICLFERGWWYAWHLRSDQQTAVSLVGGGTHDTYVPPKKQLYRYLFIRAKRVSNCYIPPKKNVCVRLKKVGVFD